jgi:hypothetical protein
VTADLVGGPLGELLADRIPKAAQEGHRRYPLVAADDFEQAMYERILRNPPKYRRLMEEGREGVIWTELRRQATRTGSEDDRYRRTQKALASGYRVDDEQFYARKMLRAILPEMISSQWDAGQAMERALSGAAGSAVKVQVSSSEDAYERYLVTVIEIATAYHALSPYHQNLLSVYYDLNQEDTDSGRWERNSVASSMGLTLKALQRKVDRAMDALQEGLGGESPWFRLPSRDLVTEVVA